MSTPSAHTSEAAEYMARKRASEAKAEALERSEKGTSGLSTGSEHKNYVVNVEDLQIPTTTKTASKENVVPAFVSSRGVRQARSTPFTLTPSEKLELQEEKKRKEEEKKEEQKAKHAKWMARYGLLKYVNLFKAV